MTNKEIWCRECIDCNTVEYPQKWGTTFECGNCGGTVYIPSLTDKETVAQKEDL